MFDNDCMINTLPPSGGVSVLFFGTALAPAAGAVPSPCPSAPYEPSSPLRLRPRRAPRQGHEARDRGGIRGRRRGVAVNASYDVALIECPPVGTSSDNDVPGPQCLKPGRTTSFVY